MILELAIYGAGIATGALGALAYVTAGVLKRSHSGEDARRDKRP